MSKRRRLLQILSIVVIAATLFSGFALPSASAQGKDGLTRQLNPQTGKVSFIGPESGRFLSASRALGITTIARPADPGMALATRFGPEFGLKNPARDLTEIKTNRPGDGRTTVRYQQNYQGIPIIGGELIVNTNDNGDLYSINGEISPDLSVQTQPTINPAQAQQTALQGVAKWYEKTPEDFATSEPQLWVYDESLLRPSTRPAELVWRMEVTPKDVTMPVRELVLVNAEGGHISLHFNQVDTAWATSSAFSANNSVESYVKQETASAVGFTSSADFQLINSPQVRTYTANNGTSLPGTFLCDQTQPSCTNNSNPHADAAHKYAIGTHNLYATQYGRDSIGNNGMTIISSVHYDSNYANAFWDGAQMVYGDAYGFPLADDVVAHELTHGVTQYESNLFYYYQSGAINEAFSDLWGEYYDQTNSLGTDMVGVKWQIGEDISGLGPIRIMSNPTLFGDPDKMSSPNYFQGEDDNGGVHANSGINNKTVFLMVDGGSFNGKTVTALGWVKTAAIYYEVNTNLLTSGADYSDLHYALQQACSNLIGQKGITSGNCTEVKDAIDAVEMNAQPAPNFNTDAPYCDQGNPITTSFSDGLESGTGNWTFTNGANPRWQLDSPYGPYAHSGLHSLYADDKPDVITDANAELKAFVVASNAYLRFAQAYGFETGYYFIDPTVYNFDGGVLEYSTNGGATWVDAGSLIDYNGYKGTIFTGAGNPLSGRSAFVGSSHGYISTRLNLAPLAGQTVTFRWRMGLDEAAAAWGWWVDDVELYQCLPDPVGIGKYDDTDGAWTYSGSWGRYNGSGPYSNTLTYSPTIGSSAKIAIIGRRFIVSYTGDSNRGKLDVYVDGVKVDTINEYNPTPQFQKKWVSPVLSAGTHQVILVHAGGGTYVDIDAIEVKVPDEVAPSAITNLSAATGAANGSVNLSWTSVGDDGNTGTASSYLIRYSTSPINGTNWDAASVFSNSLVPKAAGNNETLTVNGLVPGLTYYFAVRAQDEDLNLGGISNSPSAVAKAPAPVGVGVYDDTDSNWIYTGNWGSYSGSGPYNNTLHYTSTVGDSAQLTFTGTKFVLTFTKDANRGSIDVYVDGNKVTTINATSASYAYQQTYTSPSFTSGNHTVRFVHAGGSFIDIDAIQIVGTPVPVPVGTYDDAHAAWVYTGNWASYSGAGPYADTLHYTSTAGSSAELLFTGTKFTLLFTRDSNRGALDVFVDGNKIATIDGYLGAFAFQQLYTSPSFPNGTHTVRLVFTGGRPYFDIDAIQIFGVPVTVTAGTYDDGHAAWRYSGGWASYTGNGPYGNTLHYNGTAGNYAELTFTGRQFTLLFTKDSNRGSMDVYVDGNKVTTINAYSPTYAYQQTYTSPTFASGTHTVYVVHAGTGPYIDIDAITILP